MNPGNSEPRQVTGEPSLQSGRGANKRRRRHPNGEGDAAYPQGNVAIVSFECIFCKDNPHRYPECRGLRLTRLSDVIQHIKRQHLLIEITLGPQTALPENVILYCPRCRCLFRGMGAAYRLQVHLSHRVICQPVSIEQSGFMRSREFEELKAELGSCKGKTESEKWFIIWDKCYPGKTHPLSPYAEISVPRLQVESILQDELQSIQGSIQGIRQEEVQSIVRRCADRIYKTEPHRQSSHSGPLQAQLNIVQTANVPKHNTQAYMPSDPVFPFQPLQPQTQGFGYNSGLPRPGVDGTQDPSQRDNSITWNHDTFTNYSAPSPTPGFGAHTTSENNNVDGSNAAPGSIYPPDPYVGYPTASLEATSQEDDYFNTYGNPINRRGSQY
ncbi:hypothetical protein FMEXI_8882 [Fusarium mexicanum]|uniref:Uncharacterized protein n=1 Tax=Fusarium mexicanum TaxID=751941 RepID=A0A8H5MSR4_9HYPO|nr:hypothetical protein FMEXI_8882 [Fusarium mexicanum]